MDLDYEVKGREILASIALIAVMLVIGFAIGGHISDWQDDRNADLYKAIHIENDEGIFKHCIATSVGPSLSYGTLIANEPVNDDRLEGDFSYIDVQHEKYCRHSRTVTHTSGSGKNKHTYTTTEYYWTWDYYGSDKSKTESYTFLGTVFPNDIIDVQGSSSYLGTYDTGYHTRDVIYAKSACIDGTLKAYLKPSIDKSPFYSDRTIDETIKALESDWTLPLFWVLWLILTGVAVYGFVILDNRWLETNKRR